MHGDLDVSSRPGVASRKKKTRLTTRRHRSRFAVPITLYDADCANKFDAQQLLLNGTILGHSEIMFFLISAETTATRSQRDFAICTMTVLALFGQFNGTLVTKNRTFAARKYGTRLLCFILGDDRIVGLTCVQTVVRTSPLDWNADRPAAGPPHHLVRSICRILENPERVFNTCARACVYWPACCAVLTYAVRDCVTNKYRRRIVQSAADIHLRALSAHGYPLRVYNLSECNIIFICAFVCLCAVTWVV